MYPSMSKWLISKNSHFDLKSALSHSAHTDPNFPRTASNLSNMDRPPINLIVIVRKDVVAKKGLISNTGQVPGTAINTAKIGVRVGP